MTMLVRASSYLPDLHRDKTATCESRVGTHHQWLAMSIETEESPLFKVTAKQQLVEM
jgi:hypothetical protein